MLICGHLIPCQHTLCMCVCVHRGTRILMCACMRAPWISSFNSEQGANQMVKSGVSPPQQTIHLPDTVPPTYSILPTCSPAPHHFIT